MNKNSNDFTESEGGQVIHTCPGPPSVTASGIKTYISTANGISQCLVSRPKLRKKGQADFPGRSILQDLPPNHPENQAQFPHLVKPPACGMVIPQIVKPCQIKSLLPSLCEREDFPFLENGSTRLTILSLSKERGGGEKASFFGRPNRGILLPIN